MNASYDQLREARTALDTPLFAGLPGDINVSFEFFPPKTDALMVQLWDVVETLAPFAPHFVSVTYGAGGSTRDRTHGTVARIIKDAKLPAAAHLTCVDATKAEIREVAESYWEAGVRHIVALRGDMGAPGVPFTPHPEGYANAAELVAGLKTIAPFEISVAAYPESHPDSPSQQADIDNLKRKLDAGATRAISQQTADTRKTTVKTARAKRDAAKAALAQLQAQLAQTEVRAPAGGLVSARSVDVGQVVSLGTELVRIIRDNRLQVDARVPEGDLALVKEGGEVEVTGPDGTATPATIRQIAPVLDATTRLVVVHIDLPQGTALKSGMFARVGLKGAADRALAVPRSALVWRTGKAHVFLLAEGRTAVLTPVETGRQADGHVEIRAGLSAGDVVVTRGAGLLSNGDHVQVVASATPASGEGTPR
ncbi:MAG: hypothetical protein B7X78_00225 [Sphingomonadales bacterium 39-62-4]|nr:MAG: hypothetical protein B7X78_00225 [Sphingomonadales bacterium 39-62-4]